MLNARNLVENSTSVSANDELGNIIHCISLYATHSLCRKEISPKSPTICTKFNSYANTGSAACGEVCSFALALALAFCLLNCAVCSSASSSVVGAAG